MMHAQCFPNYRLTFLFTLINLILLFVKQVLGSDEVELFRAGYNYYNKINIVENKNGTSNTTTYNTIIDTGNPASLFVIQQDSSIFNLSKTGKACFELLEDNYFLISFLGFIQNSPTSTGTYPTYCPATDGIISFDSSTSTSSTSIGTSPSFNFSLFESFSPKNPSLYNWTDATGDIGMTYCGAGIACPLSIFQTMILNTSTDLTEYELFGNVTYNQHYVNVTTPLVFGLDFNNRDTFSSSTASSNNSSSTMQIGKIKSEYTDTLQWSSLLTENPSYHQFMLKELSICGIDLLSNWSNTWKVMVDTGSVCLTLPEELYDSTLAWFNTSSSSSTTNNAQAMIELTTEDVNNLPAFTFEMASTTTLSSSTTSTSTSFYIPLKNLILNTLTNISSSYGAPIIAIDTIPHHLCLIRGNPISTTKSDGSLNSPFIIFGTKVLESIYFAADFTSGHIGLASKLSESEKEKLKSASDTSKICGIPTICRGNEKFNYNYNTCTQPSCSHYVFVEVNPTTQKCQFQQGPLVAGLFFLILIILLESSSFFILQFTAYEYLTRTAEEDGDNGEDEDDEQKLAKLRDAQKIDIITRLVGRCCTAVLDYFLKLLQ